MELHQRHPPRRLKSRAESRTVRGKLLFPHGDEVSHHNETSVTRGPAIKKARWGDPPMSAAAGSHLDDFPAGQRVLPSWGCLGQIQEHHKQETTAGRQASASVARLHRFFIKNRLFERRSDIRQWIR